MTPQDIDALWRQKHIYLISKERAHPGVYFIIVISWLFREAWAILLMDRIWLALKMGYHLIEYISVASVVEMILNIASFDKNWVNQGKIDQG